jgi:hypothetical protein
MQESISHAVLLLINIVFMGITAILGFLIKRIITGIDERLKLGDQKFKDLQCDVEKLKENRGFDREYFAKEYVAKDDFVRDIRALDYKIDQVAQDVKKLLVMSGRRTGNAEISE